MVGGERRRGGRERRRGGGGFYLMCIVKYDPFFELHNEEGFSDGEKEQYEKDT